MLGLQTTVLKQSTILGLCNNGIWLTEASQVSAVLSKGI